METSKPTLDVLACQVDVGYTGTAIQRDEQLQSMGTRVGAALEKKPADMVVLPELCSIDYSRSAFANLAELAEPLHGASFEHWRSICMRYRCHVVYGFAQRVASNRYAITQAVVNPLGELVGHYNKIYLAQFGASMEKDYFKPGSDLFVFDVNGLVFAPIICADIRFPELSRALVTEHGVQVILHCGAYARDPSFYSWHSFAQTRALENQVYLFSVNRAGEDYGNSIIVPPWIDETRGPAILHEHDEHLVYHTISLDDITSAREMYPFLRDRKDHSND